MREIRIRLMSYDEARDKLEMELNEAFMAGETRVQVLHGIGTGALKRLTEKTVRGYDFASLVEDPAVYNPGVTLVDLLPPSKSDLRKYRA